jgi:hypothetical protein
MKKTKKKNHKTSINHPQTLKHLKITKETQISIASEKSKSTPINLFCFWQNRD